MSTQCVYMSMKNPSFQIEPSASFDLRRRFWAGVFAKAIQHKAGMGVLMLPAAELARSQVRGPAG